MILDAARQVAYGAAKIAVMGLAKFIAIEGKEHNILVNTVAPMAATPGNVKDIKDEQLRSFMENYTPSPDIAPTVAWLAHESSQVTGETVAAISRLVTRVFLAETKGYFGSADEEWTIESVRDNWHKVVDETEYKCSGEHGRVPTEDSSVADDPRVEEIFQVTKRARFVYIHFK